MKLPAAIVQSNVRASLSAVGPGLLPTLLLAALGAVFPLAGGAATIPSLPGERQQVLES